MSSPGVLKVRREKFGAIWRPLARALFGERRMSRPLRLRTKQELLGFYLVPAAIIGEAYGRTRTAPEKPGKTRKYRPFLL